MKQAIYTKSLTIALSPEQYTQIKDITDKKCISMGEWVREAVEAEFSNQSAQDGMNSVTIGNESLPYLDKILRDIIGRTVPEPDPVKGNEWIRILHDIWGESWVPGLDLCCRIKYGENKRLKFDKEQLELIRNIDESNERVLIKGPAGTGKTLIALELALRMTKLGYRVLLLCYTDALGLFLRECVVHPNIKASPIRRFALELLRESGDAISEIN